MARRCHSQIVAGAGLLAVGLAGRAILSLLVSGNADAFVPAPSRAGLSGRSLRTSYHKLGVFGRSEDGPTVSEAEKAAVLRLPEKEVTTTDQQEALASPMMARSSGVDTSAEQRTALRLQTPQQQAEFLQRVEDKRAVEEMLKTTGNPDDMGPLASAVYKLAAGAVMWTWIMNFYKMYELGHPHQI